jgi:MinD-like ATPase involved in chromosome partitioning or flagellar assembly
MTDENSLLRSYAFIKAMSKKSGAPGIHVIFDDTPTQEDADHILSRFLGFIENHLGYTVSYLGRLIQDEQLHLSIRQQRPLVLFHGNSVAKDTITGICSQLLDGALV